MRRLKPVLFVCAVLVIFIIRTRFALTEPANESSLTPEVSSEESSDPQASNREESKIPASENDPEIQAVADNLEYVRDEKKLVGRGNVVVNQKDVRLVSDQAEIFTDTKKAYAEGHVTITRANMSISGDKVFYDFTNHQGSFPNGQIASAPFLVSGEQIEQVSKYQINLYRAIVTTCPFPKAHYDITAKRATVYPGDKIVAWNVTFRVLKFPIFWWPYLVIPLDQESGPFEVSAGQSKSFGNYLLIGKTFSIIPQVEGREVKTKMHVDMYRKRGTALGNETWYHLDKIGQGYMKAYWLKDKRAPDPFFFQSDESFREKERRRFTWKHRTDFDANTNLIGQWNYFSDPNLLRQFFDREFDKEPVPQSFLTFTRNVSNYGFLVDIQKQANHFDNVLERLPEVRFNLNSTEIKETGLYYDNVIKYSNLRNTSHVSTADADDPRRKTDTEVVTHLSEFDTIHEISYPKRVFKYYDITPSANSRWTFWNHNRAGDHYKTRNALGIGTEGSTRFYRFFDFPKGRFLGMKVDRMRHIVRPVITYSAVRQSTTRAELIHPLASSSDVSDLIRFGVENRLQTKSEGKRIDIVSLNTYVNYEFNNPNNDTRFTTGTAEIILRPYSWLQWRTQVDIDLKQHRRTGNTSDIVISTKYLDFKLNHRYVLTSKESLDSDLFFKRETNVITFDTTARFNDKWSAGTYVRWEVKRHSFREYEWRIERDLHDWVVTFGQNIRHSEINWLDHELFLELRLKAYAGASFSTGQRAQFADARIGETVSGSNVAPPPPSFIS